MRNAARSNQRPEPVDLTGRVDGIGPELALRRVEPPTGTTYVIERVGPAEVLAQMHRSGLERVEQVKWGILETDGKTSFVPREGQPGVEPPEEETAV